MSPSRMIWFALLFSTIIYAGLIYTLHGKPERPFEESVRNPIVMPLYIAAAVLFVAGVFAFGSLKARVPRVGMIMRLALFEAAAIMGLMAAMIAADWRLFLPAWALALIGFFREFPGE